MQLSVICFKCSITLKGNMCSTCICNNTCTYIPVVSYPSTMYQTLDQWFIFDILQLVSLNHTFVFKKNLILFILSVFNMFNSLFGS